jgi:hypothetical protein
MQKHIAGGLREPPPRSHLNFAQLHALIPRIELLFHLLDGHLRKRAHGSPHETMSASNSKKAKPKAGVAAVERQEPWRGSHNSDAAFGNKHDEAA